MRLCVLMVTCTLAIGISVADASYLCDELDAGGRYDLGTSCRLDESNTAMERERRDQQRQIDRYLENESRSIDETARQLLLEDSLNRFTVPRRDR